MVRACLNVCSNSCMENFLVIACKCLTISHYAGGINKRHTISVFEDLGIKSEHLQPNVMLGYKLSVG